MVVILEIPSLLHKSIFMCIVNVIMNYSPFIAKRQKILISDKGS